MTRKRTPWGIMIAAVGLAMSLAGCAAEGFMAGIPLTNGNGWPGSGLTNSDKIGSGEGIPDSGIERPAFVALYQTAQGPMLYRKGKLYRLGSSGLADLGAGPREGMAWSLAMVSETAGWSVGPEGIARYQNAMWEPVVNQSHPLLDPSSNDGLAVSLTDVAFADASNGYAVGTNGTVLRYDGTSWSKVKAQAFGGHHFGTVRIGDGGDVWVAGEDVVWLNGGTWESVGAPEPGAQVSGLVVLSDAVWASTGDALWKWDKSSKTWSKPQASLIEGFVGAPQRVPGTADAVVAWAMDVGTPDGLLYQLSSEGTWTSVSLSGSPSVGLDALVLLDADTGFALSYDGSALFQFDDGIWTSLAF